MLSYLLIALHWLGVTVYGGGLLGFAALMVSAHVLEAIDLRVVLRAWRYWGATLGLSMGGLILGGLGAYYLEHGAFSWPLDTAPQRLTAAKHALFLPLWFSSFHLEIWTLEPLRRLDPDGPDAAAWEAAARRVTAQASVNALLFIAVGLLALAAR